MKSLRELLQEFDELGEAGFSSPHDFTLRQRKLENWASKARDAIAELVRANAESNADAADAERKLSRTGS